MKDVANAPEIKRLESMREMQPYNNPTRAMFIGAPGKVGYLRLGFEIDAWGKSILRDHERIAPLIVQQELYCDEGMPEMPVVYIISSGGPQCRRRPLRTGYRDASRLFWPCHNRSSDQDC